MSHAYDAADPYHCTQCARVTRARVGLREAPPHAWLERHFLAVLAVAAALTGLMAGAVLYRIRTTD